MAILLQTKWDGGQTDDEFGRIVPNSARAIEEIDIFTNNSYIEPVIAFATSAVTDTDNVSGLTLDDSDVLYVVGEDTGTAGSVLISKVSSASTTSPGAYADVYEPNTTNTFFNGTFLEYYKDDTGVEWLYWLSAYNKISRVKTDGTSSSIDAHTLSGQVSTYYPPARWQFGGDIFITNGNKIAKLDGSTSAPTYNDAAFTLPTGWIAIDGTSLGNDSFILARHEDLNRGNCKVFQWDGVSTTGVDDEFNIPFGGPQMIVNHNEILRVYCVQNDIMREVILISNTPIETGNKLTGMAVENGTFPVIPPTSKFIKDGILYFGVNADTKDALYAVKSTQSNKYGAMCLWSTISLTADTYVFPRCAINAGGNIYVGNGTGLYRALTDGNRSSKAMIESVWITNPRDPSDIVTTKNFNKFFVATKKLPASVAIDIDARVDDDSASYTDIGQDYDTDNKTYDYLIGKAFQGKKIQYRLSFTSSSTSRAQLYAFGIGYDKGTVN